jgi:hypothetical protein
MERAQKVGWSGSRVRYSKIRTETSIGMRLLTETKLFLRENKMQTLCLRKNIDGQILSSMSLTV